MLVPPGLWHVVSMPEKFRKAEQIIIIGPIRAREPQIPYYGKTVSKASDNLQTALQRAIAGRPPVGGFPYLAETLRLAGVTRNIWTLPANQSLYLTQDGPVVFQGAPLISGAADVPPFDRAALITALRTDQAGRSTFPEFLESTWRAGVVRYEVDFAGRTVTYQGCHGEEYVEAYPGVEVTS